MPDARSNTGDRYGLTVSKPLRQFTVISLIGMTLVIFSLVFTHFELSENYLREHLDSHNKNLAIVLRNSLLADGLDDRDNPARCKQWDSCLFPGFACTAGGNPRPKRAQRLRNRFDKKFIFFPQEVGHYACDGCGRCTEACIGEIDIREVLKRAVDESGVVHADSGDD